MEFGLTILEFGLTMFGVWSYYFWSLVCLQDVEKELLLQIGMKQEIEVALRLLEKDIHEKQDVIISLRNQLDEIKAINLDMHTKLQVIHQFHTGK